MTESAYLSEALHKLILVEPITPALDGITVEGRIFRSIVSLANEESMEILGAEIAKRDIPFVFDLLGLPATMESLVVFLNEIAGDCWHWFKASPISDRILLYHEYGMGWSVFLKAFLVESFSLISSPAPNISVSERLLKAEISRPRNPPPEQVRGPNLQRPLDRGSVT